VSPWCFGASSASVKDSVFNRDGSGTYGNILPTDNKRKSMLVANVAEPKLAIAAVSAGDRNRETYFVNELAAALQYAFLSGAESQDLHGELVAQIIWLLAVDQAATLVGMSVGG
jgi:hypothetical protein